MEFVRNLEKTIAEWYKKAPRLSKEGQQWLVRNIWWIALIGVIVGALSVVGVIATTLLGAAALTFLGGVVGATLSGIFLLGVIVSLTFTILAVVLGTMAISPLKLMQKKGWDLLFIIVLIEAASVVASFLFGFDFASLVWGAIFIVLTGYFLFEIRDSFLVGEPLKLEHKESTDKS